MEENVSNPRQCEVTLGVLDHVSLLVKDMIHKAQVLNRAAFRKDASDLLSDATMLVLHSLWNLRNVLDLSGDELVLEDVDFR